MALRPEEKRQILASLLEYQQSFGQGALAGMQRQQEQSDLMERRAYDEDSERRKATMSLLGGRSPLFQGETEVPMSDRLAWVNDPASMPGDVTMAGPQKQKELDPLEQRRLEIREAELALRRQIHEAQVKAAQTESPTDYKSLFNLTRNLYATLDRAFNESFDPIIGEQKKDALAQMVEAARKAGMNIGQYEMVVGDDDRGFLQKLRGISAPKEPRRVDTPTPAGQILVTSPDGQQGYIPANQLDEALRQGFTRVQ